MAVVNISGIPKNELLAALHNATRARGMGMLHDRGPITPEVAQAYIDAALKPEAKDTLEHGIRAVRGDHFYFDYVFGRPLKVGHDRAWIASTAH